MSRPLPLSLLLSLLLAPPALVARPALADDAAAGALAPATPRSSDTTTATTATGAAPPGLALPGAALPGLAAADPAAAPAAPPPDAPGANSPATDAPGASPATATGNAIVPAPAGRRRNDGRGEWLWELDPYYSSLAWEQPLTGAPLPDGGRLPEREVYGKLLGEALHPRLLLLEASLYPLPVAGTWFRRSHPEHYDDLKIGTLGNNQLNIIEGITAGFQEPWALSAFVGSGMQFTREGEAASARNRGYMGYLVSYGGQHIHNNVLIDDNWWELEWKLKGERDFREEELEWSFRVGLKTHGNPDIADVAYVGLHRSNLNYENIWLSLLNNSEMSLLTEIDRHHGRLLRQEAILGRKLPIRRWRAALSLDIGLIYEDRGKYTGVLADPAADALTIVFRPHVSF